MTKLEQLRRELKKLVKSAQSENWTQAEIQSKVSALFKRFDIEYESKLNLSDYLKTEFPNTGVIATSERRALTNAFNTATNEYSIAKGKVRGGVVSAIVRGLKQDRDFESIRAEVENKIGSYRSYDKGVTNTAISAFDQVNTYVQTADLDIEEFTCAGPPAERDFCAQLLARCAAGETFTREQMRSMSNGQGLPVEFYVGGYNCRHYWRPVIKKVKTQK